MNLMRMNHVYLLKRMLSFTFLLLPNRKNLILYFIEFYFSSVPVQQNNESFSFISRDSISSFPLKCVRIFLSFTLRFPLEKFINIFGGAHSTCDVNKEEEICSEVCSLLFENRNIFVSDNDLVIIQISFAHRWRENDIQMGSFWNGCVIKTISIYLLFWFRFVSHHFMLLFLALFSFHRIHLFNMQNMHIDSTS